MIGGTANLSIIITAIDKASATLNKMGNNFTQAGAKMKSVGKSMTMGLTLPIAALGIASTKMGLDFSKGVEYANTMLKLSGEDLEKFKTGVLDLSDTYGKAAADIARAGYSVSSVLHTSGEDTITILESIAKGAKAGKISTEEAGNAVIRMMSIYGTSAEDAMEVVDTLSATVKAGNANWQDMAQILPSVASLGKPLGVSINEVAGAFAVASSKVGSTAEAGTAVRGIFNALMKPSDDLKEAIKEMGNEMGYGTDMTAQMMIKEIGLEGVLSNLGKEYGNNAEKIGQLFPNIRAITGATAMFANEGKDLATAMGMVEDSVGETNAQIEAGQGTAEDFADAINRLKNAGIRLFTIIEPYLSKFIAYISDLAKKFSDLSPKTKKIIVLIMGLAAVLGPLLFALGMVTQGLGGMMILMKTKAVLAFGRAIKLGLTHPILLAQKAFTKLGTAIKFVFSHPIIIVITAFIALIILVYRKIKELKDITGSWSSAWKLALLNAKINWSRFLIYLLQGVMKVTKILPKLNLAVSESMAKVAESMGAAAREFNIVATETKNAKEDVDNLEESNEELQKSLDEINKEMENSTDNFSDFGDAAEKAAEKTEKAFSDAVSVIKSLRQEMKDIEESMTETIEDYSKKKLDITADYEDQIVKKIADAENEIISLNNKVVQARADGNIEEANDLLSQLNIKKKMIEKFHENYKRLEDDLDERKKYLRMNELEQLEFNKNEELLLAQKTYLEKQIVIMKEAIEKARQHQLAIKMIGEEKIVAINAAIEKTKTFKEKLNEQMKAFDTWKEENITGWRGWLSQVNSIIGSMSSISIGGGLPSMSSGSYQSGTSYVPKTGLYTLHKGESVITKNDTNKEIKNTSISDRITERIKDIVINITGNTFMSDEETAEKIGDMIITTLKTQMRFVN